MANDRILNERYRLQPELGKGSFGVTYLAEDIKKPNQPQCVIKQLQLSTLVGLDKEEAKRRFEKEAETLNKLGKHDRIPQLWNYFIEDDELYLVQEFIDGQDLSKEISPDQRWSEGQVIGLLYDVLEILKFIQQQNPPIIHRDINPKNLIQRESDRRIVLIDFGAVKEIIETSKDETELTLPFGTGDYRAEEQKNGKPCLQSDIYGLGKTALFALTGNSPRKLNCLPNGCVIWPEEIEVSNSLKQIIDKMVQRESSDRYATAAEALEELAPLHKIGETVDGYTLKAIWEGEEFSQTYLAYKYNNPNDAYIVKGIIPQALEQRQSDLGEQEIIYIKKSNYHEVQDIFKPKILLKYFSYPVNSKIAWLVIILASILGGISIKIPPKTPSPIQPEIPSHITTNPSPSEPPNIVDKILDCFEDVPNVPNPKDLRPDSLFNYGHSSTFVTVRKSIEKKIKEHFPYFRLKYIEKTKYAPDPKPGSTTGIMMLLNGELDIGQSSRPLKDKERERAKTVGGYKLKERAVAKDFIAIAVNPSLGITQLTLKEIKDIYTGKITNWQKLGGPDLKITPYSRSLEASGLVQYFVENILKGKFNWDPLNSEIETKDEIVESFENTVIEVHDTTDAMQKLENDRGGIYYGSAALIIPQCTVKSLSLGIESGTYTNPYEGAAVHRDHCNDKNKNKVNLAIEQNGVYPSKLIYELYVIIKANGGIVQQAGEAYANLLLTEQGQQSLKEAGLIRIRPPKTDPKECLIPPDASG